MLNRLIDTRIVPGMSSLGRASVVCGASKQERPDQSDRREHEVHEQAPAPVDPFGERAAEQQSDNATAAGDGTEDAESLGTLARIGEGHRQQRQSRRSKKGSEHTLARTSRNKHLEVDGRAPDGGGNRKSDQSDDKCAPSAEQISSADHRAAASCRRPRHTR